MGLKKTEAKEYAKMLYLDTTQKLTIKEIADRVGVRPNTVGKWIKDEEWDKLRKSLLVTRQKMIGDLYDQLEWLNDSIREREVKVADSKESNTIAVITSAIKKLETETSIAEIFEVGTAFLDFLKPIDFDIYKKLIPVFDAFINSKLK
ncbi:MULTISPECIES: phage terminase small subunit-related protein [Bizionia]|uniref:DDE transposase family protein n=1 Tax=Bizionia algoritergicola TaxID=291187 RepID=A0A5D0QZA2_9FLAO|nr:MULTISPECIES: phage terminase small subunit-related protein [Bizionia]TYB74580.1 DDE transposase family protein [Bizionia algoritergicola]